MAGVSFRDFKAWVLHQFVMGCCVVLTFRPCRPAGYLGPSPNSTQEIRDDA